MSFEVKLAWRYFRARRKSLARFTSLVAVVGIAAGVASLILAQSLARGFSDEMQDKILANTAHISIFTIEETEIANWREIKSNVGKLLNVSEISATTYESVAIVSPQATNYAILRVTDGIQHSAESHQPEKSSDQRATTENLTIEISIGKQLAEKSGLKAGDAAEIITLENESAPQTVKVMVRDIFQTGIYEYDTTWIRISPENFAYLKKQPDFAPTVLSVTVKNIYNAAETAGKIRANLGEDFKVVDWQEANRPLFAALSLEKKAVLAIISLIIFIAALNITTTLALLVNERRLDIAVLRTCGAKTRSLILIFLTEGLYLGFVGILFGAVAGLIGCAAGNYFKVIKISAEVYSLNYIPFHPTAASVLLIVFIAFLLSLTATVFPAYKASKIKPLENLRAN